MKHTTKQCLLTIWVIVAALAFSSCDKEPEDHMVRILIETNSDEPVRVYGLNTSQTGLVIKNKFEKKFVSKKSLFTIGARCYDENTLITVKVWLDGKLIRDVAANRYLDCLVKFGY